MFKGKAKEIIIVALSIIVTSWGIYYFFNNKTVDEKAINEFYDSLGKELLAEVSQGNEGKDIFLFYSRNCFTCPTGIPVSEINDNDGLKDRTLLVLHPSYQSHDLENLEVNMDIMIKKVIASKKYQEKWDKIIEKYGNYADGFVLYRKDKTVDRIHPLNWDGLTYN